MEICFPFFKGKENPRFQLMYCDKRISIRYTVDKKVHTIVIIDKLTS